MSTELTVPAYRPEFGVLEATEKPGKAGEIDHSVVKELVALAECLDLILNTHFVVYNHNFSSTGSDILF